MNKNLIQSLLLNRINDKSKMMESFHNNYDIQSVERRNHLISSGILSEREINKIIDSRVLSPSDVERIYSKIEKSKDKLDERSSDDLTSLYLATRVYRPRAKNSKRRSIESHKKRMIKAFEALGYENIAFAESSIKENRDPDFLAVMMERDNKIYVTFRGTETKANMMTNLSAVSIKDVLDSLVPSGEPKVRFHRGFKSALEMLSPQIDDYIDNIDNRDKKTVCYTGHSLGGALAKLYSFERKPDQLITFGAPRVSSNELSSDVFDNIDKRLYANYSDIIRLLPMRFLGFRDLYENTILDTHLPIFSIAQNHTVRKYANNVMERFVLGSSFNEYCMMSAFNGENLNALVDMYPNEFAILNDEIKSIQEYDSLSYNDAIKKMFKKEFGLNSEELNNYERAISGEFKNQNTAFRIIQNTHKERLGDLVKDIYANVRSYQAGKKLQLNDDTIFEKSMYFLSMIGTLVSQFLKTGNIQVFNVAFKAYNRVINETNPSECEGEFDSSPTTSEDGVEELINSNRSLTSLKNKP